MKIKNIKYTTAFNKEELQKSIKYTKTRLNEISLRGIPKKDLDEPRKTINSQFNHMETKRLLLDTQLMVIEEIEKTDKVTNRALKVAWISLCASIISIGSTIIIYQTTIS